MRLITATRHHHHGSNGNKNHFHHPFFLSIFKLGAKVRKIFEICKYKHYFFLFILRSNVEPTGAGQELVGNVERV
jgi:hypothetical protein